MAYECSYNNVQYLFDNIDLYHFCSILGVSDTFGPGNGFDLLRGEFKTLAEAFRNNSQDTFKRTARKILTQLHPDKITAFPKGREVYTYAANRCAPIAYFFQEQASNASSDIIRTLSNIMSRPFVEMAAFRGQPSKLAGIGLEFNDPPATLEKQFFDLLEGFGSSEISFSAQYVEMASNLAVNVMYSYVGICVAGYSLYLFSDAIKNAYYNYAGFKQHGNEVNNKIISSKATLLTTNLANVFNYARATFALNSLIVQVAAQEKNTYYAPGAALNPTIVATGVAYSMYSTYVVTKAAYNYMFAKPSDSAKEKTANELISDEIKQINSERAPKYLSGIAGLLVLDGAWTDIEITPLQVCKSFEDLAGVVGTATVGVLAGFSAYKAVCAASNYLFSEKTVSANAEKENDTNNLDKVEIQVDNAASLKMAP